MSSETFKFITCLIMAGVPLLILSSIYIDTIVSLKIEIENIREISLELKKCKK